MPSLRKRVTSYFRQLSFHNEPREKRHNVNENSFVTRYLQGHIKLKEGPPVIHGKTPGDLPNYDLSQYETGADTVVGCYTGPTGGLTTVKRTEKHLSVLDQDIDFIDTADGDENPADCHHVITTSTFVPTIASRAEGAAAAISSTTTATSTLRTHGSNNSASSPGHSPNRNSGTPLDISTMQIKVAGQTYHVTNRRPHRRHSKSHSIGTLADFNVAKTTWYRNDDDDESMPHTNNNINMNNNNNVDDDKEPLLGDSRHMSTVVGDLTAISGDDKRANKVDNDHDAILVVADANDASGFDLAKSKSEGNPFRHRHHNRSKDSATPTEGKGKGGGGSGGGGRLIRMAQRPRGSPTDEQDAVAGASPGAGGAHAQPLDRLLPAEWTRRSDYVYGISDSLYDRNLATRRKNGDPIADCFGVLNRRDSAVLAVADGVNWGEKACIAAKSAIHASLHYLNTTIFHDTVPFDNLVNCSTDDVDSNLSNATITSTTSTASGASTTVPPPRINNTRDVFVCLLRAFNCAHDLILENGGMLTTLTVAVVLPIEGRSTGNERHVRVSTTTSSGGTTSGGVGVGGVGVKQPQKYVCCVCTVGDTLAYVYSQQYGVRELTKGSHDINCNRDMRDALGALGPVDGINPELSNLTLSITTVHRGDIIIIASDGLTDNFDPNVCRFTVSTAGTTSSTATSTTDNSSSNQPTSSSQKTRSSSATRPNAQASKLGTTSHSHSTKSTGSTASSTTSSAARPVKPPRKNYVNKPKSSENTIPIAKGESVSRSSTERSVGSVSSRTSRTSEVQPEAPSALVAHFVKENAVDRPTRRPELSTARANPVQKSTSMRVVPSKSKDNKDANKSDGPARVGYNFLRSKTLVDFRSNSASNANRLPHIPRNPDGLPFVTPLQRYELTLLLMEDILRRGLSGSERQCVSAKRLCENLIGFTVSVTNAKRNTLEDTELYYDESTAGVRVELGNAEKKARRKRALERVQNLPGKLDHVTVVACNVGMV